MLINNLRHILLPSQLIFSSLILAINAISSNETTQEFSPFYPPSIDETQIDEFLVLGSSGPLLKRRDKCKSNYASCDGIGRGDACCPDHTKCTHDENGNLACCPDNAVCTGALPTVTLPASTVPHAPYPFYYIPTSYPNSGACESAYSYCNEQYTRCTSALEGTNDAYINPVTISVVNGEQFTYPASITAPTSMPTSEVKFVCSSLRSRACYGLKENYCTAFGNGGDGNHAMNGNGDSSGQYLRNPLSERSANDIVIVGVVFIAAGAGLG